MKKIILKIALCFIFIASTTCTIIYLQYNGYIWINTPSFQEYPNRGIDISNHQGIIYWDKVKGQNFTFVFMKATEGDEFTDHLFSRNWRESKRIGLQRGAYHFYHFSTDPESQARHFIKTVPNDSDALPPVVDIEFGGNSALVPEKKKLINDIQSFLKIIENNFNKKAILYVTNDSYNAYIKNNFKKNPIWIRELYWKPKLESGRTFDFWQYCNRGRVAGINGFVDLNVKNSFKNENK